MHNLHLHGAGGRVPYTEVEVAFGVSHGVHADAVAQPTVHACDEEVFEHQHLQRLRHAVALVAQLHQEIANHLEPIGGIALGPDVGFRAEGEWPAQVLGDVLLKTEHLVGVMLLAPTGGEHDRHVLASHGDDACEVPHELVRDLPSRAGHELCEVALLGDGGQLLESDPRPLGHLHALGLLHDVEVRFIQDQWAIPVLHADVQHAVHVEEDHGVDGSGLGVGQRRRRRRPLSGRPVIHPAAQPLRAPGRAGRLPAVPPTRPAR
mmetsp:Transcript_15885/g.42025  ORF Transcript_15885/g.42025 Transcript_15885/m.42025 type:complete len:263 (+) Transcript_15885:661-1449(+)